MPTIRKTITITEKQDQSKNAKYSALKNAITEGMNSGVSDKTVPEIMKEVEVRMQVDGSF